MVFTAIPACTSACFKSPGGGTFRYKPMQDTMITAPQRNDRLAHLWEELQADLVPPCPAAKQKRPATYGRSLVPCREHPSLMRMQATLMTARTYAVPGEDSPAAAVLQEAERLEPVLPSQHEPVPVTASDEPEPVSRNWRGSLEKLVHGLLEPEAGGYVFASTGEETAGRDALSDMGMGAAQEAPLPIHSPFRWEPKPAWINAPLPAAPPLLNKADPTRFAAMPKIPRRPLHKQPFFRRFFFYLRGWLRRLHRPPSTGTSPLSAERYSTNRNDNAPFTG
jgi:hypothetical protein